MPHDSQSTANYAAVISDLRRKREELDRTIAMLEAMANLNTGTAVNVPSEPAAAAESLVRLAAAATMTALGNNGIGDRVAQILFQHRQEGPLSTRRVTDLLIASGFELKRANPINNVWSALDNRTKTRGDIEKVDKGWVYVDKEKPGNATRPVANGLASHA